MQALRFSLRLLARDWHAGELRVLALALVLAVASVTSVGFFTDRVRLAVTYQANELLAADLAVLTSQPPAAQWAEHARNLGLATAQALSFPSVVMAGDNTQLAEVKAVTPGYPLRGALHVAPGLNRPDTATQEIPAPGTAWVEPRLMQALSLEPGATISVGAAELKVAKVLTYEPDRGGNFLSLAPHLLMNMADVPRTELVQPGSRVWYRLLIAGEPRQVDDFRRWIAERLPSGARLQGAQDARPELRRGLDRAQQFLGLAALVSVVLAGVALAMSARRHVQRHTDGVAVLRCLGAGQGFVVQAFALEMFWLALIASAAGCLIGAVVQLGLPELLRDLVPGNLPGPSWRPIAVGMATGVVTLAGFAIPPVLRLRDVPPARVLRKDLGGMRFDTLAAYSAAVGTLVLLMLWQTGDARLTAYVLLGALAAVGVLALAALGLIKGVGALRGRAGTAWRFGLANIARRAMGSVVQVVAFGLGITVLLLLTLVRADLLASWRASLPPDAPNYFLINVQPPQVQAVRGFLEERGRSDVALYPMVRGRLVAINGKRVSPDDYQDRARRLVEHEFNLSWAEALQPDNRIVAGRWWTQDERDAPVLSVEAGLAETLNIKLGDELRFAIAGEEVAATVTSLRAVEWDSFHPNFFVIAPPGLLKDYPATYITSFYLPAQEKGLLTELVKRFPNITILDVDALMTQMRRIIGRVALAVEYVFGFTLLAGLAVLFAAIQSTQDERRREGAVLRVLGASRRHLNLGTLVEFAALGTLAGALGALAASLVGYVLSVRVFDIGYHLNLWIWLFGLLGGAVGVGLAGLLGTRSVLQRPPLQTLQQN